ncbi:MAG: HEPN domain-containing protein [Bacteroidetes bacterium]|nr:HEPN domain-containing protein [Bacteroidota bacterium]MBS1541071.1 HEPN domain-containing protein [Bacteroidota bacterium]
MNSPLHEFINYRIEKSEQAYADAKLLAQNERWNACVNRLYYSIYYIVSALALKENIITQTYSGLKSQFNLHFVKTGKVSIEFGKLYSDLFDSRQKGDYGDMYDFDKEAIDELITPVGNFIKTIKQLI